MGQPSGHDSPLAEAVTPSAPAAVRWWLLPLALGIGIALYTGGSALPLGAIYSVRQVQAGVRQQPARWVGRTVWVYGELVALCKLPDGEGPANARIAAFVGQRTLYKVVDGGA